MTRNWERCTDTGLKAVERAQANEEAGADLQAATNLIIGTLYAIGAVLCQQLDAIETAVKESGHWPEGIK